MASAAILEKFKMAISPQPVVRSTYSAHRAVIFAIGCKWVGLDQRSYSMPGPVSTWMGDRVPAGKPSRYVASQLAFYLPWDGKMSNNNNNNKRQFVRRRNMSVDITRAPYRQSGNVVRDSSTETRL